MTSIDSSARALWRITVAPKRPELDSHGAAVLRDTHDMGFPHVRSVRSSRLFLLEGALQPELVDRIAGELLADPVTEVVAVLCGGDDPRLPGEDFDAAVEVHLKGGVMDPVAASTLMAIRDMTSTWEGKEVTARETAKTHQHSISDLALSTARLYRMLGVRNADEAALIARRLLANDCIEDIYLTHANQHDPRPDHLPVAPRREFSLRHVAIRGLDDPALTKLSREGHLFLSLDEMRAIQLHYQDLGRDPTDLELETFAQTWSEHCVHKTLKSAVRYVGAPMPNSQVELPIGDCRLPIQGTPGTITAQSEIGNQKSEIVYGNLLRDTIARATRELIAAGKADWCLSVFEDNAGIIAFDDEYGIAFKAETHNHPSAIEPYGGAATGIGGCIRDIMGCGLGAKPIANTDVFCVAAPNFPAAALPKGVLHPRRVLKGVVSGVRDYGNRMGIPTVNGAIVFDDRYLGNPLVFCGCVGLIPRNRIRKEPKPGDLVVLVGGRTGRDGIHGATFSSAELTDTHADEFSHAVQIGNAITQKQVLDAQLAARDHATGCLYTAVTDCGAGGLSSAVGEMAAKLGATVDLDKVPLKYSGLRYDEIWISEAQERMVFSVPPDNWPAMKAICDGENVEATAIGTFRDDGQLFIRYIQNTVGEINCGFLHDGIPKTTKDASWSPTRDKSEIGNRKSEINPQSAIQNPKSLDAPITRESVLAALGHLNTSSKEWVIRQYDHEVQGGSVIKPLVGPGQGPSDAAVIRPVLGSNKGIAIANGICPTFVGPASSRPSDDPDPYWMAVAAIDEAIRNVVCVGGDPRRTAILDNFCWGNCEDPENMGALVRACQACYDAAMAYGTPFISGKDSLNNEFAIDPADAKRLADRIPLRNNRIRIPGTLLVSAVSMIGDVKNCVTMDAKFKDDSTAFYYVGLKAKSWSEVALPDAAELHRAVAGFVASGEVVAAHDVGDSGILPALAEMALAGRCGIRCECDDAKLPWMAPVASGYILQVTRRNVVENFENQLGANADLLLVALPDPDQEFSMFPAPPISLDDLAAAWRAPLKW